MITFHCRQSWDSSCTLAEHYHILHCLNSMHQHMPLVKSPEQISVLSHCGFMSQHRQWCFFGEEKRRKKKGQQRQSYILFLGCGGSRLLYKEIAGGLAKKWFFDWVKSQYRLHKSQKRNSFAHCFNVLHSNLLSYTTVSFKDSSYYVPLHSTTYRSHTTELQYINEQMGWEW